LNKKQVVNKRNGRRVGWLKNELALLPARNNGACSKNLSERQTENILIFYLAAQIFLFLLRPHYGAVHSMIYQGDFNLEAKTRMMSLSVARGVRITVHKCCSPARM